MKLLKSLWKCTTSLDDDEDSSSLDPRARDKSSPNQQSCGVVSWLSDQALCCSTRTVRLILENRKLAPELQSLEGVHGVRRGVGFLCPQQNSAANSGSFVPILHHAGPLPARCPCPQAQRPMKCLDGQEDFLSSASTALGTLAGSRHVVDCAGGSSALNERLSSHPISSHLRLPMGWMCSSFGGFSSWPFYVARVSRQRFCKQYHLTRHLFLVFARMCNNLSQDIGSSVCHLIHVSSAWVLDLSSTLASHSIFVSPFFHFILLNFDFYLFLSRVDVAGARSPVLFAGPLANDATLTGSGSWSSFYSLCKEQELPKVCLLSLLNLLQLIRVFRRMFFWMCHPPHALTSALAGIFPWLV